VIRPALRRAVVTAVVTGALLVGAAAPAMAASSGARREIARAGVLVPSDFPATWTQTARTPSSDAALDAAAAKVASCRAFRAFSAANRRNPRAKSKTFEHAHSDVTNTVSVYATAPAAANAIHTFSDTRIPACLETLFRTEFREQLDRGSTKGDVSSIAVSIAAVPGLRIGDDAVAYQGPVAVQLRNGSRQTIDLGIAAVRVGEAVSGYSWTSDVDISQALQPAIVASVARLQRAQSAG
jgi:hypothetical protein